ncbi:hypothetical protein [Embleya scabrispora]|uniref:hypothetical protein n=1 Tax=Embleya scabrispora TaxID=159449 RepID=UPI00037AA2C3|nr:hypothetical protein [Embleya scabrispora]MYS86149.1 hypothetical protein [Streptomyces sp. SID5474]
MRRICTATALAATVLTLGSAVAHADAHKPPLLDRLAHLDPSGLGHNVDGPAQKVAGIATTPNTQR